MSRAQSYKRQRSPIILIVCEGRNKTERIYFSHYQTRDSSYRLLIKDSEATDVMGMAKRTSYLLKTGRLKSQKRAVLRIGYTLNLVLETQNTRLERKE